MRLLSYEGRGGVDRLAVAISAETVADVTDLFDSGPWTMARVLASVPRNLGRLRAAIDGGMTPVERPIATLRLLPPIPRPSKIIAVGRNYREHAAEEAVALPEAPLLFAKLPSALVGDGATVTWSASLTGPAPSDLPTVWADPEHLQRAALHWLAAVTERLEARAADVVADCVERTRTALDFASPVFAHGDVVPVNVLIDERGAATVLDFEDARLAPGAFDRAMLWTTLALHHPAAATAFESLIAKPGAATSYSVDRDGLATTGCLQRLERAYDPLAGLGSEAAAMGELARAAHLVARFHPRSSHWRATSTGA